MANPFDRFDLKTESPLDQALQDEGASGPIADLARSIYAQESGSGKKTKTSNRGAVGGMQILPTTFAEVADKGWDINDPVQNARAGVRYLGKMLSDAGGDPRLAAIGYYGGPGAISAAKKGHSVIDPQNPEAPDTFTYADSVLSRLKNFAKGAVDAVIPSAHAGELPKENPFNQFGVQSGRAGGASSNPFDRFDVHRRQSPTVRDSGVLENFSDALVHHLMAPMHGIAQGVEHGVNFVAQRAAPDTSFAKGMQRVVDNDDAAIARDENAYQGRTSNSLPTYLGAGIGEVLPFLASGPLRAVTAGSDIAANALAKFAPEAVARNALARGASRVAGAGASGAAIGALSPVTSGQFGDQKINQLVQGGAVGAAFPIAGAAGRYAGGVVSSAIEPFTVSGRNRIVSNFLNSVAQGGPRSFDSRMLVPGTNQTLAQQTGNPGIASVERAMHDADPSFNNTLSAMNKSNADARLAALNDIRGDEHSVAHAQADRDAAALPQLHTAFQSTTAADPRYVDRAIVRILKSPSGQRDVVKSTLNSIRKKLFLPNPIGDRLRNARSAVKTVLDKMPRMSEKDADALRSASRIINLARRHGEDESETLAKLGALSARGKIASDAIEKAKDVISAGPVKYQDDPEQLYGIRKSVTDLLSNVSGRDNSASQLASRELQVVKKGLDRAIEKAAPGYAGYLKKYADMSKPVDAYKFLQGLHLTDSHGVVQLGRVQSALTRIAEEQKKPGARAAKAVTPKQIQLLQNIRDDLMRQSNSSLGKSIGSNTVQNLATQSILNSALPGAAVSRAGRISPELLGSIAGLAGGFVTHGPIGAIVGGSFGNRVGRAAGALFAPQNSEVKNALARALLDPAVGRAALDRTGPFAPRVKNALAQRISPYLLPAGTVLGVDATLGR